MKACIKRVGGGGFGESRKILGIHRFAMLAKNRGEAGFFFFSPLLLTRESIIVRAEESPFGGRP
jgi:hypothetical protein